MLLCRCLQSFRVRLACVYDAAEEEKKQERFSRPRCQLQRKNATAAVASRCRICVRRTCIRSAKHSGKLAQQHEKVQHLHRPYCPYVSPPATAMLPIGGVAPTGYYRWGCSASYLSALWCVVVPAVTAVENRHAFVGSAQSTAARERERDSLRRFCVRATPPTAAGTQRTGLNHGNRKKMSEQKYATTKTTHTCLLLLIIIISSSSRSPPHLLCHRVPREVHYLVRVLTRLSCRRRCRRCDKRRRRCCLAQHQPRCRNHGQSIDPSSQQNSACFYTDRWLPPAAT